MAKGAPSLPSNQPLVSSAPLDGPNSPSDILILHWMTIASGSDFHPTAKPVPTSNTVTISNNKKIINPVLPIMDYGYQIKHEVHFDVQCMYLKIISL